MFYCVYISIVSYATVVAEGSDASFMYYRRWY